MDSLLEDYPIIVRNWRFKMVINLDRKQNSEEQWIQFFMGSNRTSAKLFREKLELMIKIHSYKNGHNRFSHIQNLKAMIENIQNELNYYESVLKFHK